MKRIHLIIYVVLLAIASGVNAQTWTAPTPQYSTLAASQNPDDAYYVQNIESGWFLAGGTSWYTWNTSLVLVDPVESAPLAYYLISDGTTGGWFFSNSVTGRATFISGSDPAGMSGRGELHIDMASQGHNTFDVQCQSNGYYHIRAVESDNLYGSSMNGYSEKCWGWEGMNSNYPTAVYATVRPTDGFYCDWGFVNKANMELYQARLQLYKLTATVDAEGLDVDYGKYLSAYNSSNLTTVTEAVSQLAVEINEARSGEASEDNPVDYTSMLTNASFDTGDVRGWIITFVNEANATNIGYQQAEYINNDVRIIGFIEAWTNTAYNPNVSFQALGDGELSQTVNGLPAGKYKLSVDCIASQQFNGNSSVRGVQLFVSGGNADNYQEMSTGNGVPEHFELTFVTTGGNIKFGLRTVNTTANWIAADNFMLTCYGKVTDDPAKVVLQERIAALDNKFGELGSVKANKDVKATYQSVRNAAAAATENYDTHLANLNTAVAALESSINDYVLINDIMTKWTLKVNKLANTRFTATLSTMNSLLNTIEQNYDSGIYVADDVYTLEEQLNLAFMGSIGNSLQPGDDVTFLLENPDFDTNASGWTATGFSNLTGVNAGGQLQWGGAPVNLNNGEIIESGVGEVWRNNFDLSQTIKNLPAGLYTLSVKAFERNEDNAESSNVQAYLYATIGGQMQTGKIKNVHEEASDEQLYDVLMAGVGAQGTESDKTNAEGKYIPNGRCGANVYFFLGHYETEFNITVKEVCDITIGLHTDAINTWVIFDNFRLVYQGAGSSAYAEAIQKLINEADATRDSEDPSKGSVMTQADLDATEETIAHAEAVLAKGGAATEDECVDVMDEMRMAIDNAKASKIQISKMFECVRIYSTYRMPSVSSTDKRFTTLLGQTYDQCTTQARFADIAEVNARYVELAEGFSQYVQYDHLDATTMEPADITAVIYNPDGMGYGNTQGVGAEGWDVSVGTPGYGNDGAESPDGEMSFVEFYQQSFNIHQTIYGLVPGTYVLGVQGFYRDGSSSRIENSLNNTGPQEQSFVKLYAGDRETPLLSISAQYMEYTDFVTQQSVNEKSTPILVNGQNYYLPNSVSVASQAIAQGLWQNSLRFEVKEGQKSVSVGLRMNRDELIEYAIRQGISLNDYWDWTFFDNWTLHYIGNGEELPIMRFTIQNDTIEYGDPIPAFRYIVDKSEGADQGGEPAMTCTAKQGSPAGTYPITIDRGKVTYSNSLFVDGVLVIKKAPLTVTLQQEEYVRHEMESNPEFKLQYSGWKMAETENVLTQQPTATTKAIETSPAGEYPIVISGGSSVNYTFNYGTGTLIVKPLMYLTVTVQPGGMLRMGDYTVIDGSQTAYVYPENGVALHLTPFAGQRLKSVTVNGEDWTNRVVDGTLALVGLSGQVNVVVAFEADLDLVTYTVDVQGYGQLRVGETLVGPGQSYVQIPRGRAILEVIPGRNEQGITQMLSRLSIGGTDVTANVADGIYVVRQADRDTLVTAVFVDSVQTFTLNNLKYGVVDMGRKEVKIMSAEYSGHVVLPAEIQYQGLNMKVVELSDAAFAGNPYLISVSIPATVSTVGNALFDNCERLAAIDWNAPVVLSRQKMGILTNGNLLIYVTDKGYAPEGFQNIVVGNGADHIILGDYEQRHNFYCPKAFTARLVEYTHIYRQQTQRGVCQGWETLTLPFHVTSIVHERNGVITPYAAITDMEQLYSGVEKPFWLYTYSNEDHFVPASSIEPNIPYLISMPNDAVYPEEYRQAGRVTFRGENVQLLPVTVGDEPGQVRKFYRSYTHEDNFQGFMTLNVSDSTLNQIAEGSTFVLNLRETRPFEAYIVDNSAGVSSYCPFDSMADAIGSIPESLWPTAHGQACGTSGIYDLSGRKVGTMDAMTWKKLPKGIYIVEGKRIIKP